MATPTEVWKRKIDDRLTSSAVTRGPESLEVCVLHTRAKQTLEALRTANALAEGLARIRLLVLQVVPYPLPLNEPQVPLAFTKDSFRALLEDAEADACVDIRLCRDKEQMIEATFPHRSLIVIGGRRRWWPTAEGRIAKQLERLGHQVVFTGKK